MARFGDIEMEDLKRRLFCEACREAGRTLSRMRIEVSDQPGGTGGYPGLAGMFPQ